MSLLNLRVLFSLKKFLFLVYYQLIIINYVNKNILSQLGGHSDSWDVGSQTGANDDGGGFVTCYEALRLLAKSGLTPKRTIRFIAWSGEEYGGSLSGASQYANDHKDEMNDHVIAFESDLGSRTPVAWGFSGGNNGLAYF